MKIITNRIQSPYELLIIIPQKIKKSPLLYTYIIILVTNALLKYSVIINSNLSGDCIQLLLLF